MSEQIDLEYQYQTYLQKVGLRESKMSYIQRTETKRAFMAGAGQTLLLSRDVIGEMEEDEAVEAFGSLLDQAVNFWKKQ